MKLMQRLFAFSVRSQQTATFRHFRRNHLTRSMKNCGILSSAAAFRPCQLLHQASKRFVKTTVNQRIPNDARHR